MSNVVAATTSLDSLLKQVLTARVYDVAVESPLERAPKLSRLTGCDVYLKREDLQPVHSFKLRGAYNKMSQLTPKQRLSGVIAASAGNHAQGVALSAKRLGMSALIVMPRTTPAIKIDAVKSYGAEVELHGDNYSEAYEYCLERIRQTGRTFIHPFDDPLVIAGQGTVGREIIEQLPIATHIFVPVGGGGLIAGIASYVKTLRPDVKIIGVQAEDANTMQPSLRTGKRVTLPYVGIFSDGTAVKQLGEHTFERIQKYVDDAVSVTTDQICAGIKAVFEDTRAIVEPAGALAAAGIMRYDLPEGAQAVAICSGANVTFERLQQVAERTLIGSGKEALFAVTMPERPGALEEFCQKVVGVHSITELAYRLNKRTAAQVLIGLRVSGVEDRQKLQASLTKHNYAYTDLSEDDIAKEHVRHIIGGTAPGAITEKFYRIDFPERPGALVDFLTTLDNHWNISLFHYRSAASDSGRVLIGFEAGNRAELEQSLARTNFAFTRADTAPSIDIFIK